MKYIAHLKQSGDGCDYTIACTHKMIELPDCANLDEAYQVMLRIIREDYSYDEQMLELCVVHEVNESRSINLNTEYRQIAADKQKISDEMELANAEKALANIRAKMGLKT